MNHLRGAGVQLIEVRPLIGVHAAPGVTLNALETVQQIRTLFLQVALSRQKRQVRELVQLGQRPLALLELLLAAIGRAAHAQNCCGRNQSQFKATFG